MPRRPRIEIVGYYHIINRGVNRGIIFRDVDDYEYFLELLSLHSKTYNITIHNYCLMSNHYHLLLEITQSNLSKFMRQINGNYAIYFNKKYKRSGHLWQGRFKSSYVTDEAYLYTLILYIEQNPLKAKIVKNVEEYPYSSAHYFLSNEPNALLNNSWITTQFQNDKDSIREYLHSKIDKAQLQELKIASSLVEASNIETKPNKKALIKILSKAKDTKKRNLLILQAYQQGYSQHLIAKVLGLAQPTVSRIVKRMSEDS